MRVLVVEDDKALGMFLQKGLGSAGHEVNLVGDGEAALQHAAAGRPDLMVLDLGLSRPDRTEVLARIRTRYKDVSVVMLTGRSDVEERIRGEIWRMAPDAETNIVDVCVNYLRKSWLLQDRIAGRA
jgi:DNA-binding response OmpR family regulator